MNSEAEVQTLLATAPTIIEGKRAVEDYDVFLCHNSADKPEVRKIAELSKAHGVLPCFDQEDLRRKFENGRGRALQYRADMARYAAWVSTALLLLPYAAGEQMIQQRSIRGPECPSPAARPYLNLGFESPPPAGPGTGPAVINNPGRRGPVADRFDTAHRSGLERAVPSSAPLRQQRKSIAATVHLARQPRLR